MNVRQALACVACAALITGCGGAGGAGAPPASSQGLAQSHPAVADAARRSGGPVPAAIDAHFKHRCHVVFGHWCGGHGFPPPRHHGKPQTILVTFQGSPQPLAVADAVGAAALADVTPINGTVTIRLPHGSDPYRLAYRCPTFTDNTVTWDESYAIEASANDGTDPVVTCNPQGITLPTTTVTVSVDASAIPSATSVVLVGAAGTIGGSLASTVGSITATLPAGSSEDLAALAEDAAGDVLGVKIVRDQTLPGTINGGNPIVLAATDATTIQAITVDGVPAGYTLLGSHDSPSFFTTSNGTAFVVSNAADTAYAHVPAGEIGTADYYSLSATALSSTGSGAEVYTEDGQYAAMTQGAQTITLPLAWTYVGPTPAQFPTFSFAYSGFGGTTVSADQAVIAWPENATTTAGEDLIATPGYLAGVNTAAMPNLTTLSGFNTSSAASGSNVYWSGQILAGLGPWFDITQVTGTNQMVYVSSTYTEP